MSRTIRLRSLLLGGLVIQLAATAMVIVLVGYFGGHGSANQVAERSQRRATQRVRDYLHDYLNTPQQVIRLMADEVASGRLDPRDDQAVRRYLWGLHASFPNAPYLNYGWANGDFVGLGQVDNISPRSLLEVAKASTIHRLLQFRLDASGETAGLVRVKPFADFRSDGWYSKPLQAGRPVWTPIYNWVDAPEVMAMGAGMPIRVHGQLVGVAGVDLFLANISVFLKNLAMVDDVAIYIVEPSGLLVADSSGRLPFSLVSQRAVRHQALNSDEPVIRETASALIKKYGNFGVLDHPRQLHVPIRGSAAMVRVEPYRDGQNLDWRIIVVLPEADVYEDLRTEAITHLSISLLAILISGAIGLVVVEFVIRGIDRLVVSADAMAEGDLSQSIETGRIAEMARLARSLNSMAERLRRSFAGLRSSNREVQRLVTQHSKALVRSEQQLQQEILQRQRMEQTLAGDARSRSTRLVADPATGLLNRIGLERQLASSERSWLLRPEPVTLLLLACSGLGADPQTSHVANARLQRIAVALETCATSHQGVAAQLERGRFALLLRDLEAPASQALLESLAQALQPLTMRVGMAVMDRGSEPEAWRNLMQRAEEALAHALATPVPASAADARGTGEVAANPSTGEGD